MLEQVQGFKDESGKLISWKTLSELTGFPESLIRSELLGDAQSVEDVSLDNLRDLMLQYLDKANLK